MRATTCILLLLGLLAGSTTIYAQAYFRHYQVENGLSNSTVHCCLQDKRGFMWMGTKDGLDRFDGYSFKVFRHDEDDSTSIGSNFLKSIYEDRDGIIYAGTNNGLYRYNDSLENFTRIAMGGEVRAIHRTGNYLWYIIGGQLRRYDLAHNQEQIYPQEKYFDATSFCFTNDNIMWVSTANGLLEKYNATTDSFTAYDLFASLELTGSRWIEKLYYTSEHTIFIGTSTNGFKRFDIADSSFHDILKYNANKTAIFVRDFIETGMGEYWVATESGIFIYNRHTGKFTNLKKDYNNPYSLSDNAVYTLYKDREGGIWAGTFFGGISYFPRQYTVFKKYFPDYGKNSLSGNAVREICKDRYGNLWIGTEDAGLNKLDTKTGLFTNYKPTGLKTDLAYSNIHGLLANGDELWIGTFEHGLDIMDIRTGKVIRHYAAGDKSGLSSNFIVTVYKTTAGKIYVGTWAGLQRYDAATDKFIVVTEVPPNFIYHLQEDPTGTLWAGTIDNGLFYFNENTGKKGNLQYNPTNKNSIPGNFIIDIFPARNGALWIATEGGGLCKYDAASNSFKRYNTKTGLPSNTVLRILEDSKHTLWITTTRGLVNLNPATDSFRIYTSSNGLLNDQFNYNSGYKDTDGTMYFGSVKGMISFNPDAFTANTFKPPVYITALQVNNKDVPVQAGSPLTKSIAYTQEIILSHDQSSVNIDFAALTYTAPDMTEYAYKMDGVDKDWTYLKQNRKAYFTDLSPGKYTFKVRAYGTDGNWKSDITSLSIQILPPVWASTWAYLFYVLVALSIIYLLIRNYHEKTLRKNKRKIEILEHEKEKEIYEAKIEFFTNVAHEIRTPLTLIKAPLERVIKKTAADNDSMNNLKLMEKNTNRLIDLTSQLLDFRKTETKGFSLNFVHTNINNLLQDTYTHFTAAAEQKNISYHIRLPDKMLCAYVDMEAFKKILSNLISNAFKFSKHLIEVVLLHCDENAHTFTIQVKNDGPLIAANLSEKIFEPFYSTNNTHEGTGIGLALSRSLAELHNGTLYLDRTDHHLNTFNLTLPIHQTIEFNLS